MDPKPFTATERIMNEAKRITEDQQRRAQLRADEAIKAASGNSAIVAAMQEMSAQMTVAIAAAVEAAIRAVLPPTPPRGSSKTTSDKAA
jgi:hypothetical protein